MTKINFDSITFKKTSSNTYTVENIDEVTQNIDEIFNVIRNGNSNKYEAYCNLSLYHKLLSQVIGEAFFNQLDKNKVKLNNHLPMAYLDVITDNSVITISVGLITTNDDGDVKRLVSLIYK